MIPPRKGRIPPLWDGHTAERIFTAVAARLPALASEELH